MKVNKINRLLQTNLRFIQTNLKSIITLNKSNKVNRFIPIIPIKNINIFNELNVI